MDFVCRGDIISSFISLNCHLSSGFKNNILLVIFMHMIQPDKRTNVSEKFSSHLLRLVIKILLLLGHENGLVPLS